MVKQSRAKWHIYYDMATMTWLLWYKYLLNNLIDFSKLWQIIKINAHDDANKADKYDV